METLLRQCKCILMQNITKIYTRNVCNVTIKNSTKQLYYLARLNKKCDNKRWYGALMNNNKNKCMYASSHLFYDGNNNASGISISKQKCSKPDKKETLLNADIGKHVGRKVLFENVIEQNKEKFRETEQRLRAKSNVIIKDIKATKDKMKVRMEEAIERENIYTIPNVLCVSRIAITPYLGALIVQSNFDLALVVLGVAAFTDLVIIDDLCCLQLDGWIARTWKSQSSKLGSFLDPMADKILIATLFLTLTYSELIPLALTALIITRDIVLVVAGFVIRYQSLPPPRTLTRYFDASHVTAQLAPTFISKANTAIQLLLVGTTIAAPVFHYIDHPALQCLWFITGATTIASAISYAISKDTYKIIRKTR